MEPETKKASGSLKQMTRRRKGSMPEPVKKNKNETKEKKHKKSREKKEVVSTNTNNNDIVAQQPSHDNTTTATTTKKFTRRPLSTQPPRTRASICVVPTAGTSSPLTSLLINTMDDYDPDDPDWAEMESYHERRAAYSCNDVDSGVPRVEYTIPWSPPTTNVAHQDTGDNNNNDVVLVTLPPNKQLDPESHQRYRNGVLNERIDNVIEYIHCFVCLNAEPASLMSITAMTGKLVSEAIGAGGERPIYRRINICYACQLKRNLMDPLIRLPCESLSLFKSLYGCD